MTSSELQSQFCLNDDIYLLNHSVGKMPCSTRAIVEQHYFSPWETSTGDPWPQWLSVIEGFQQSLAALFNAQANEFCPQTNISSGLVKLLGSMTLRPEKTTLLYSENDFPSTGFVIQQAEKLGFSPKQMSKEYDPQDIESWNEHLTNDVAAVLIAHVHYNTSRLVPVDAIGALCRQRDIFSIVDIAQSAGVVPIDFSRWPVDAVLGSCVKWLCGGPGAGYLWLADDVASALTPKDVGWFSHQSPFEFDINHFQYHQGALRFWGGTPSVLPFCVASNSIKTINEIGVKSIRLHNQLLTQHLVEQLPDSSHQLNSPCSPEQRGGTLVIKLSPRSEKSICKTLVQNRVQFDSRALGIRISPHIYNSAEQIDRLAAILTAK